MIELAVMVEGQDGLNWDRWQRLARAAEDWGIAGLYRSDHFTNPTGPHLDSLDLWASLSWLASHTERIEFGQLVSPLSFRHPVVTAWSAAAIDDLSGGRFRLGLGAGWQEREHTSYGFDLLDTDGRFARFEEGLQVVRLLLRSDEPTSFAGNFYQLDNALLLPRPARAGGPPIVIGGNGPRRTLPLAARYADEWNAVFVPADRFRELNARLDEFLDDTGRERGALRRTLMTRAVVGSSRAILTGQLDGASIEEARSDGMLVGTPVEIADQLATLGEAGVQRVMLQWLDLDDLSGLDAIARATIRS